MLHGEVEGGRDGGMSWVGSPTHFICAHPFQGPPPILQLNLQWTLLTDQPLLPSPPYPLQHHYQHSVIVLWKYSKMTSIMPHYMIVFHNNCCSLTRSGELLITLSHSKFISNIGSHVIGLGEWLGASLAFSYSKSHIYTYLGKANQPLVRCWMLCLFSYFFCMKRRKSHINPMVLCPLWGEGGFHWRWERSSTQTF